MLHKNQSHTYSKNITRFRVVKTYITWDTFVVVDVSS